MAARKKTPPANPESETAPPSPAAGAKAASKRLKEAFKRAKAIEKQVESLMAHAAGLAPDELDPIEATAYMARRVLMSQMVEASSLLSPKAMEELKPADLTRYILNLESARLAGDRLRIRHEKLYAQARQDIMNEVLEGVRGKPGLLAEMRKIFPALPAPPEARAEGDSSCPAPPGVIST